LLKLIMQKYYKQAGMFLSPKFVKTFCMKKLVLLIIIFALAGLLAYKLFSHNAPPVAEKKDQPLSIGKNTGVFNTAFAGVMSDYYALKDALVDWDSTKAGEIAHGLALRTDSLPFRELKADTNIIATAKTFAAGVSSEANGLAGETSIEQKRREFNMITEQLYDLVRTVKYDGEIIYHVKCPMAFNESEEAWWLTDNSKIINPYLGRKHPKYKEKMLGCGEINDSLNFARK
jgi:hypothetical protein